MAAAVRRRICRSMARGGILDPVHLRDVVLFTTTLLAIVNPISSAVLFAAMAGRFASGIQCRMANQSALAILVILLVWLLLGGGLGNLRV